MAGSEVNSERPSVLMVGGDGYPSGVPRNIRHLVKALAGKARITVASDVNHGGYDGLAEMGADHMVIRGLHSSLSPMSALRGWRGLRRVLRGTGWDLVWLHARLPVILGRVMLALRLWRPNGRVVVTYHGLPFGPGHRPGFANLSKGFERGLLRVCPPLDLVFLSQSQADRMMAELGGGIMSRHTCHVLPNSSDLGPLPPVPQVPGRRHLVMTGRCGWQKNYPLALRLFAHLPPTYTLTLCGSGTDGDKFQTEAAGIVPPEMLSSIRFAGPLKDVRPILAEADGYLLTSRYEGQPIGTIEAFEAGLPLILSRFDGAADVTEGHPAAILHDLEDLEEAASQIETLLARAEEAGEALRQDIQRAWSERWSFDVFEARAGDLFGKLT